MEDTKTKTRIKTSKVLLIHCQITLLYLEGGDKERGQEGMLGRRKVKKERKKKVGRV